MELNLVKIAVLYIATGRYTVFWNDFYQSCEKNFVSGAEKEYFIFTDAQKIDFEDQQNVHRVFQNKLGWPYDTLMRFEMFLRVEEELQKCDYIFFFNSNTQFVRKVSAAEILPGDEHDGLTAATFNWKKERFTYERNPLSTAYIPEGEGDYYFRGGVNGGKCAAYLQMIKTLEQNIKKDLENNIVAVWHDESHINHYLLNRKPLVLSENYCFDGAKRIGSKVKIIMQNKDAFKFGGKKYLRGESSEKLSLSRHLFNKFLKIACCFIPFKKIRKKVRNYYRMV